MFQNEKTEQETERCNCNTEEETQKKLKVKDLIGDLEVDDSVLFKNLNSKRLASLNVLSQFNFPEIAFA